MIRTRFVQGQAQKATNPQRVGRPPGDATLRIDAFEVPQQEHSEVPTGLQARPSNSRCVELPALRLHEGVELRLAQELVQSLVERMPRTRRQFARRDPHRLLPVLTFTHGHAPQSTLRPVPARSSGRVICGAFTTGY